MVNVLYTRLLIQLIKKKKLKKDNLAFLKVLKKGFIIIKSALSYLPIPPLGQDMTQGQFLSGVYQVWIQSFSFS